METGLTGFDEIAIPGAPDKAAIFKALSLQTPDRIRVIAQAMRHGLTDAEINQITAFDPWFLSRIREIIDMEAEIRHDGLPVTAPGLRRLKMYGFTDARLAILTGRDEAQIRRARRNLGVVAVFKRIDTCAAEFEAQTPYMYSTYEAPAMGDVECEARPSNAKKVVILGGGPNRIGQGIEFDYCCVHACYALTAAGYETIMVNCNPETVSTDYDTSDRLYFEPLTLESVLEILRVEQDNGTLHGVIVQLGGQTPLKLAQALANEGIPILGTTPDAIDLAEDRERFQQLLHKLGLKQPHNGTARSRDEAFKVAADVGYPLVIRPSFVLGGRAMEIIRDDAQLERYIRTAVQVSDGSPVLLDSYLSGAIEVDVDALSDGKAVHVCGIMEHIEEAGVHSGDSACCLPPHSLSAATIAELKEQTVKMALALNVVGLMNVQFAIKGDDIYVLEVNPRASRTVPFVAKATDSAIASIAARLMAGEPLSNFPLRAPYAQDVRPRHALAAGRPEHPRRSDNPLVFRQRGRPPLRPLPRRGPDARAGNALNWRGDGLGPHLRAGLPQGANGGWHHPADDRPRVPVDQGYGQDRRLGECRPRSGRHGVRDRRHQRHRPVADRCGRAEHPGRQGL